MKCKGINIMFNAMIKYFAMACFIAVALVSCNSGRQKNDRGTANQYEQYVPTTGNQNILTVESLATEEEILKDDSLNIELRISLASKYYSINELEKAINHFLIVNKIDKNNLTALIGLGNLYYDTEQNGKAIDYYEKSLEFDSNNLNVRCDMGTCYLRVGKIDNAIQIFKENIEMDFNHAQSHNNLAVAYRKNGNEKEAENEKRVYDKIISDLRQ